MTSQQPYGAIYVIICPEQKEALFHSNGYNYQPKKKRYEACSEYITIHQLHLIQ